MDHLTYDESQKVSELLNEFKSRPLWYFMFNPRSWRIIYSNKQKTHSLDYKTAHKIADIAGANEIEKFKGLFQRTIIINKNK